MKPLTKTQQLVYKVIQLNPGCQNDDIVLFDRVYQHEGYDETKSFYWNMSRLPHPESITRARRKLHEYGLITYSKDALRQRTNAFKSEQARHGSYEQKMAEIVQPEKPKYHLAVIGDEEVMVQT